MVFNSLAFGVFLVVLFFSYYLVPNRFRPLLLLIASCVFYMAYVPYYILILFFLIGVDFVLAQLIHGASGTKRKLFLFLSIASNLGILFTFKYLGFFLENIAQLASALHWNYPITVLALIVPLGLSFHVFQSLAYVIEVYRGHVEPERSLTKYALYVMFFAQLVAGPIERPGHLLPQIHGDHKLDPALVRAGLERMLFGFFKKIVIADRLALIVDHVFGNIAHESGLALFIASVAFAYQLYCDFSGYSDIAVGSAMLFGYRLTENFNRPFAARSIGEFWRRWHISLSSWLRDYLYHPLVFSAKRISRARLYAATLITFVLIGLWHGANWTFVIMGALHGCYIVIETATAGLYRRVTQFFKLAASSRFLQAEQTLVTFLLVTLSFVFFRAPSVADALHILGGWLRVAGELVHAPAALSSLFGSTGLGVGVGTFVLLLVLIGVMETVQYLLATDTLRKAFEGAGRLTRWSWYYAFTLAILFLGYFGGQQFIYFRF